MGEATGIEWTDRTFNPWIGCQKVSAGCDHCYAETLTRRYGWAEWGPRGVRRRTSAASWRKRLARNRRAGRDGCRARVFCASLADVFDKLGGESAHGVKLARDGHYRGTDATQCRAISC